MPKKRRSRGEVISGANLWFEAKLWLEAEAAGPYGRGGV